MVTEVTPAVATSDTDVVAESPELAITGKQLIILDGKEVPAGQKKLKGSFRLVSLDKEQGFKKYGEKGKNGVVELTTVK